MKLVANIVSAAIGSCIALMCIGLWNHDKDIIAAASAGLLIMSVIRAAIITERGE